MTHLKPEDFGTLSSASSTDLRRRLTQLGRSIVASCQQRPDLSDLIRDSYVTSKNDARVQWMALLPADPEFKTSFPHLHLVLPPSELDEEVSWFGLNIEFQTPRAVLVDTLRDEDRRQQLRHALSQAPGFGLWVIQKHVLRADQRKEHWGSEWPDWPDRTADEVSDEDLLHLLQILEQPPVPHEEPDWMTTPAIVVGSSHTPSSLIAKGRQLAGFLLEQSASLAPTLRLLVQAPA